MKKFPPLNSILRGLCAALLVFAAALAHVHAQESDGPSMQGAMWVWYPEGAPDVGAPAAPRWFRKTFEIPAERSVVSAVLLSTCDDLHTAYLNEEKVASAQDWNSPVQTDVSTSIVSGKNVLAIEGGNGTPGPAGLLAMLRIELDDGQILSIPTDASWVAANEEDEAWLLPEGGDSPVWKPAMVLTAAGSSPWGTQTWMNLPSDDVIPAEFVRIEVPGFQKEMDLWRELYWLYYKTVPVRGFATIWDALLPVASLTPAVPGRLAHAKESWKNTFLVQRYMTEEGYVSQDQHTGIAHPYGWPFPTWVVYPDGRFIAGRTTGWHFFNRARGSIYPWLFPAFEAQGRIAEQAVQGWQLADFESLGGEPDGRWRLKVTGPNPTLTAPAHGLPIEAFCSPFLQIRHLAPEGMPDTARIVVRWNTLDSPEFSADREVRIPATGHNPWVKKGGDQLCLAPMYEHPAWKNTIIGLQIAFEGFAPDTILQVDSIFTTLDTRTPASNGAFLLGTADYFRLTGDLEFLKTKLPAMRKALRYAREHLGADKHGLINPEWVGQDARPGYAPDASGELVPQIGHGVGMDIIPYGHDDLYSTNFYYGGLMAMIELEEAIARNPQWELPAPENGQDAKALRTHAEKVRQTVRKVLFNSETGRFGGSRDDLGTLRDYGHSMVNLDAVYYGLADKESAQSIMDWLDGKRIIEGDTAKGADIYHWEFAPRFGTLKNSDWWNWLWKGHEHAYDAQCQDGGTWFSLSAQDLINRANILGGDNAWKRLSEILAWYSKVKDAGGFRAYYNEPSKGTLQGGGTAGALGLDNEFVENVRAPYAVLEGVIGFRPTPDGLAILPRLPKAWPSAKVTGLAFRDQVLDLELTHDSITVTVRGGTPQTILLTLPEGFDTPSTLVILQEGKPLIVTKK